MADDEGKLSLFASYDLSLHKIVAVLWKAFPDLQGSQRADAINRIGDLEYMYDHEACLPIVNAVKYIGPKAGPKITSVKQCPLF
jgi:hypothetical protein